MGNNSVILLGLLIVMCIVITGGVIGLVTDPAPTVPTMIDEDQSWWDKISGFVTFSVSGLAFLGSLMTFQAQGMPYIISILFFIPLGIIIAYIILKWVRGTS